MNKGRPPKGQGDFPFDVFSEYQGDNVKEDPVIEDIKPENVEFSQTENKEIEENVSGPVEGGGAGAGSEYFNEKTENDGNQFLNVDESEKVYINLTEKDLIIADAVVSGLLESAFHFIGFKKNVEVLSYEEAKIIKKIMPDIEIEKSWKNFFIVYLTLKVIK